MIKDKSKIHADRLSFLTDSAAYYAALDDVFRRARKGITIVGWSFDDRVRLVRDTPTVGELLVSRCRENRDLTVDIAVWDAPAVFPADQFMSASFLKMVDETDNLTLRRVPSDSAFSSRHEKYVVVDDNLVFVGGIDISRNRWDGPDHRADQPGRVNPDGKRYVPYHDIQAVFTGRGYSDGDSLWPQAVPSEIRDVEITVARTRPGTDSVASGVREVEELYLDMIESATKRIYIENQYFSSDEVTRVLVERLRAPEGPEVIVVLPRELPDPVGKWTMGINTAHHISVLQGNDRYGRLGVYNLLAPDDPSVAVKVHSKTMVVDGRRLTLGSANISERSFRFDYETNIAVNAGDTDDPESVERLEDRLLAGHTGLTAEGWREAVGLHGGSRLGVLRERCTRWPGIAEFTVNEAELAVPSDVVKKFDMDGPPPQETVLRRITRSDPAGIVGRIRRHWVFPTVVAAVVAAIVVLSQADIDIDSFLNRIKALDASRPVLAGLLTVLMYWLTMTVFVSIVVPIVFFAVLHGPWWGVLYSTIGLLSGAAMYYGVGLLLHNSAWLHRFKPVRNVKKQLEKIKPYGIWAVAISRMVPSGPFMVVNIVTGLVGFTPAQFIGGSVLGLLPGIIGMSLFGNIIHGIFTDPNPRKILLLVLFIAGYFLLVQGLIWLVKRIAGWVGDS